MPTVELHQSLPLPSKVRQIDSLQVMRAVAVSLVAWCHLCQSLTPVSEAELPSLGIFGIDVFFVISGFIMSTIAMNTMSRPGGLTAWAFMKRRLIRIFPIYWIYALLGALRLLHSRQTVKPLSGSLLLLPFPQWPRMINLSWTLMFEMFFYAVLSAILLATVRYAVPTMIAVFCALATAGLYLKPQNSVSAVVCNPILLEFVFGALIALVYRRGAVPRYMGWVMLCAGAGLSVYIRMHPTTGAETLPQMFGDIKSVWLRVATWGSAAGLLVGGAVCFPGAIKSRVGRTAVIIGNASYSAYLGSTLIIEFSMRLLLNHYMPRPLSSYVEFAFQQAGLAAVLAFGWISYQFVEWPLVRWLQRKLA